MLTKDPKRYTCLHGFRGISVQNSPLANMRPEFRNGGNCVVGKAEESLKLQLKIEKGAPRN